MIKWNITVYMKNGERFEGAYYGTETSSGDVFIKLLTNGDGARVDYFAIYSECGRRSTVINTSEIAAIDIFLPENA